MSSIWEMKASVSGERRESAGFSDGCGAGGTGGFVSIDGGVDPVFDAFIISFASKFG